MRREAAADPKAVVAEAQSNSGSFIGNGGKWQMKTIFLIANLAKEFVPETRAYIRECLEKEGLSAVFSPCSA